MIAPNPHMTPLTISVSASTRVESRELRKLTDIVLGPIRRDWVFMLSFDPDIMIWLNTERRT